MHQNQARARGNWIVAITGSDPHQIKSVIHPEDFWQADDTYDVTAP